MNWMRAVDGLKGRIRVGFLLWRRLSSSVEAVSLNDFQLVFDETRTIGPAIGSLASEGTIGTSSISTLCSMRHWAGHRVLGLYLKGTVTTFLFDHFLRRTNTSWAILSKNHRRCPYFSTILSGQYLLRH